MAILYIANKIAFRKRGISKRTGLIARKIGMKTEVDYWGRGEGVTVLQIQDNHVSSPYRARSSYSHP